MTKSELIDRLAAQFPQLVAKDAELAVKMILDAMAESLAKGERIEIRGFGSFGLNYRPPRTGRNPKSGSAYRCRRSTSRTSRPARSCANASTSRISRRTELVTAGAGGLPVRITVIATKRVGSAATHLRSTPARFARGFSLAARAAIRYDNAALSFCGFA